MVNTTDEFTFKPADGVHEFQREVEILAKLQRIAEHEPNIRTSRILGLVYWDDHENLLMGMMLDRIGDRTLHDVMMNDSIPVAEKRKWIDQVDETVRQLHEKGIVWGNAMLANVTINPSGHAILTDFGGGYTLGYVDRELRETKEGDMQGLERMRSNLLS